MSKPLFQKRHYVAIAAAIRKYSPLRTDRVGVAKALAILFKADNPNFSVERFYEACDV